jgi:hypothetical protein
MTLPRNRNVGSFTDIDCGQTRFDNPTSNPRLLSKNQQNRERELPDPVLKIRAEWIRPGKFAPKPHAESMSLPTTSSFLGGQLQPMKLGALIVRGLVMPSLVPGIYVVTPGSKKDVDGRDKPGHDGGAAAFRERWLKRRRHHNDGRGKNRCCKVPPPCF